MRAVVLVGGFGTRLQPLTLATPKQMLPVVGVPMIERVVGHLAQHGVDEAVLSLGYRPDAFIDAYPDAVCAGSRLVYAVEPEPLDTAGAIRFAARHAGIDETFLVVNGDVLTDLDVGALVAFHRRTGAEGTIHLTRVEDPSRYGVVPTDEHGRVVAFVEKPPPGEAPTDLINAGAYVLEPSVLARIAGDRRVSIERETFPAMVDAGSLYALATGAYWIDAGTPATYLQCQLDLLAEAGGTAGPGWLGEGARVDGAAQVRRSVLHAGARVAAGAVVEESVLLPGAEVGPGSVVRRSVLGAGARVGEGATVVELSVLGDGATVADGTTLHGARVPDSEGISA